MATTTHTPGPWHIERELNIRNVIKGGGYKPRTVAIIEAWTTRADADLMAAAPELLDALRNLLAEADDDGITQDGVDKALAAIRKATGE